MDFEWDSRKARENLRKHGVSFLEAVTVLGDQLGVTVADPDHSFDEERYLTVGYSNQNRLLIVAHAEREGKLRIISARELTKRERKDYEANR